MEKQIERDEKVIDLMTSMDDAYTSITEIESVRDQTAHLRRAIQAVVGQTFECALFIQEYAGRGFGSMLPIFTRNHLVSNDHFLHRKGVARYILR